MSLLTITSKLLKECPLSKPFIADEFGCSIGYLNDISAMSGDPGIKKLECLHDWLIDEKAHRAKQQRKCKK